MSMLGAAVSFASVRRYLGCALLLLASNWVTSAALSQSGADTLALSSSLYVAGPAAGNPLITVARTGDVSGATSVNFATVGGSAVVGVDVLGISGTLTWAAGDGSAKSFVVPLLAHALTAGTRTFTVTLDSAGGGATLGTASATVSVTGTGSAAGTLSLAPDAASGQDDSFERFVVSRSGGASGPVTVQFATVPGTAVAGTDFSGLSGSLFWADGDASPREIAVPILGSRAFVGSRYFSMVLSSAAGGAVLGSPSAQIAAIVGTGTPGANPAISVSGNKLLDAQGNEVQLRGVNVSGLEGVAILGWSPSNPWGGSTGTPTPDWNAIKSWGSNVVRIPLNEASWLGLHCVDAGGEGVTVVNGVQVQNLPGTTINADPGGNYQATVASSVAGATAAGLYVILDLHLAAPGTACPMLQNAMADADHSIAFWTSVAAAFKASPNVIFELFNEPFLDMTSALVDDTPWPDLLNGGATLSSYEASIPSAPWQITVSHAWSTAGMQQMLNAVRATGATNVVLTSSLSYAGAIYDWLQYKPIDPINQLGAVWHAYSVPSYPTQVDCVNMPGCSANIMASAIAIKAAGYPVVITEYGDTIGGSTAPWASVLLPFADANNISYLGWTWDVWQGQTANDLIVDASGTPSQGYGTYVKAHYLCRAAGNASCP